MRIVITAAIITAALTLAPTLRAEDSDAAKLKVVPTGRIRLDGALYATPERDLFSPGVALIDAAIGVKADYGKWTARLDIAYAYGKVGLRDIFVEYRFNGNNLIRGGNFIHQYGLQSSTSPSMKTTMEETTSNEVFNAPRQLGIMYKHSGKDIFGAVSLHAETSASLYSPTQMTKMGWGSVGRFVWRPKHSGGIIIAPGISAGFATPQYRSGDDGAHDSFTLGAYFPTRVDRNMAINAVVTEASNMVKFTPELLLGYKRVALETQYFYNRINRKNSLPAFSGQGAYATVRGILIGKSYAYNMAEAGIARPEKKTLEAALTYNYTDLNSIAAGIRGGRLNDVSLTLNYYINKYFMARFRYSYTHTWDRCASGTGEPIEPISLNAFQIRFQAIF